METYAAKTSSTTGQASARFEWLKTAVYTDTDVFAIGLNSNFSPVPGSESAVYKYDMPNYGTKVVNYTTANQRDVGGYAYKIDLYDYGYPSDVHHRGYMQYRIVKSNSSALVADVFSHYAHQERTFEIDPAVQIPWGGGLQLSYATDFDKVTGHAQLS